MAEAGPSTTNNRLKRQHSIDDYNYNDNDRKRFRQEVSLVTEYETLELGLLSARSARAQSQPSPRSVAETPEVQARRDAELRMAIREVREKAVMEPQRSHFPGTLRRDSSFHEYNQEIDRYIPSALKANNSPLIPSLTRQLIQLVPRFVIHAAPQPPQSSPLTPRFII
ncbi:hypothetical protein AAF712_014000 [Marasmius tenuissimus]|uniref:Uncharacterized protein n=1 Tax=Marasmius tenuissimus TaxID=585030 RepID=A0ABR2ZC57_9AGAR